MKVKRSKLVSGAVLKSKRSMKFTIPNTRGRRTNLKEGWRYVNVNDVDSEAPENTLIQLRQLGAMKGAIYEIPLSFIRRNFVMAA